MVVICGRFFFIRFRSDGWMDTQWKCIWYPTAISKWVRPQLKKGAVKRRNSHQYQGKSPYSTAGDEWQNKLPPLSATVPSFRHFIIPYSGCLGKFIALSPRTVRQTSCDKIGHTQKRHSNNCPMVFTSSPPPPPPTPTAASGSKLQKKKGSSHLGDISRRQ